jgi:riboflavin synthase
MGMRVSVAVTPEVERYIVEKGSIAVDGVSLTVVSLVDRGFTLYFIPETLSNTVVSEWKPGDEVNVEVDVLAKYVERSLQCMKMGQQGGSTSDGQLMKKLMEGGFV